jgi:hypothetical protein
MRPKECKIGPSGLYGTFNAMRSDFNLPLKFIPTVVGGAHH